MTAQRGELWWANLDPARGSEQAGRRPVLVFQNDAVNQFTRTSLVIPVTTNLRRAALPSCVKLAKGEGGLPTDSVAICHQLRVVDKTRLQKKMGSVSPQAIAAVENYVTFTLGMA